MESSQDGLGVGLDVDIDINVAFAQLNLEVPMVQLTAEQQHALDAILKGKNVFCTGAAGTGKSEVLRSAFKTLTSAGKRVGLAAPTGIVAESIGGTTIHSLFGIGVPQTATDFRHRMHKPDAATRLQALDALVVDEISCIAGELLDRLDVEMRELRGSDAPFGGIQLVFFGDFMQLPPVSATMKMRDDHGSGFCPNIFTSRGEAFQSRLWADANFMTCTLSENFRQLIFAKLRAGN